MKFHKGDTVYKIPIRFWEDKTPTKCIIVDNTDLEVNFHTKNSVLVYSEKYGHNVYVDRKDIFFSEEKAKQAIELYSQLNELYFDDENDKLFSGIFNTETN